MGFLVQIIIPYILLYKYWAIFVFTFLASLAIPIPAGTLLITSSAFASQGYFNITTIFIVVYAANLAGDNLSYWLARLYGKKILSRVKFIDKILSSKNFMLIERSIKKHPGPFIFISRFEVISTLTTNMVCGLSKMPYKKFLIFEAEGTFANILFYAALGYVFGDSWQAINKLIGNFSLLLFLLLILGLSLFWKKIIHRLSQ
jgi:membrane-associated protein